MTPYTRSLCLFPVVWVEYKALSSFDFHFIFAILNTNQFSWNAVAHNVVLAYVEFRNLFYPNEPNNEILFHELDQFWLRGVLLCLTEFFFLNYLFIFFIKDTFVVYNK